MLIYFLQKACRSLMTRPITINLGSFVMLQQHNDVVCIFSIIRDGFSLVLAHVHRKNAAFS